MDSNNLIPPSHFEADSLEGSPKDQATPRLLPSRNILPNPDGPILNTLLKTPNDFALPSMSKQPFYNNSNYDANKCCSGQQMPVPSYPKCVRSQVADGNLDNVANGWKTPPFQTASNNHIETALLIKEMKQENKKLKEILMNCKSEKDSKSSMNVITHQVRYIERLQQDLSDITSKLKCRDDQLSNQQLQVQEANLQCQQQVMELKKLKEEIEQEKEEKVKLSEVIAQLKTRLASSEEDKQKLQKVNDTNLSALSQRHADELQNVSANARKVREEMKREFANERNLWEDNQAKLLKEWEAKCEDLSARCEASMEDKLHEFEEDKVRINEQEKLLQAHLSQAERNGLELKLGMAQLEEQLKVAQEKARKLENEIEVLEENLKSEKETVATLKAYISQVQTDEHAVAQWKVEKEKVNEKIERCEEEKEELKKTLEMLNVRFQSVSKILEMQEESVVAHTTAIPNPQSQNRAAVVTSRWRMKVFELMVQCKSQDIALLEESSKHQIAVKDVNIRLEDQTREKEILSNRLNDVEAQLKLKGHVNQTLENQNEKLKENLQEWKAKADNQEAVEAKLREAVAAFGKTSLETYEANLSSVMEKCLRLEQRLAFANNRVRTVGDLLKRRDAMWRVRLQQVGHKHNRPQIKNQEQKSNLNMEILQLTEERDLLSQQLANDAAQFEQTIKSIKKDEENHKRLSNQLEKQIISCEEKLGELSNQLEAANSALEEEKDEKETLLEELKQINKKKEQEMEKVIEKEKNDHYDELQEKETTLTQVKRELTKTVVALRQAERSAVREKNRLSEQLELKRQSWLTEEEKLRNEIRNFQKENNLLMTTLRQEGLMSAYRAARARPVTMDGDAPSKRVHFNTPRQEDSSKMLSPPEDVDKMLQDLTNLSEKLLADSD